MMICYLLIKKTSASMHSISDESSVTRATGKPNVAQCNSSLRHDTGDFTEGIPKEHGRLPGSLQEFQELNDMDQVCVVKELMLWLEDLNPETSPPVPSPTPSPSRHSPRKSRKKVTPRLSEEERIIKMLVQKINRQKRREKRELEMKMLIQN